MNHAIHCELEEPRSALCLSGGGIRSATFCLGVLQGLARWNVLGRFHYLSTVSGGGYIGSWLSRWIAEDGLGNALSGLAGRPRPTPATVDPEPSPLRYLRAYSSYLAPRRGLSTDLFTLVVTYLRNLTLNWFVLVPLLFAGLMAPRVFMAGVSLVAHQGLWLGCVLLGMAMVLGIGAVAVVERAMSSPSPGQAKDEGRALIRWLYSARAFLLFLAFGTGLLTLAWPGLSSLRGPWFLAICVCVGLVIHVGGVAVGRAAGLLDREAIPTARDAALDVVAIVVSGTGGGLALWLGAALFFTCPAEHPALYTILAVPYLLGAYWVATMLYMAACRRISDESHREWWARAGGVCLARAVFWIVGTALVLYGPVALLSGGAYVVTAVTATGVLSGLFASLWGYLSSGGIGEPSPQTRGWKTSLGDALAPILAGVFLVVLVVGGSLATSAGLHWKALATSWRSATATRIDKAARDHRKLVKGLDTYVATLSKSEKDTRNLELETSAPLQEEKRKIARKVLAQVNSLTFRLDAYLKVLGDRHDAVALRKSSPWRVLAVFAGALGLGIGASWLIGVNRFSLHGLYCNRLVRCYLGASQDVRNPEPFTGFDSLDDLALYQLQQPPDRPWRLFHVVNAALNMSGGGGRLDWQDRQAAPFTMSPLHAGSPVTGYQPCTAYGDEEGLSLGRAMTISGAAVSPSMGYHSSRLVSIVMTLFNARLGWWLPNPGESGRAVWQSAEPRWALLPLIGELLGRTAERSPYVYVSDGGHFDNLGLYEMVARRCRRIVVVDAVCDPKFEYADLARAIRMIRSDLGISVEFPPDSGPALRGTGARSYTVGRIRYSDVDGAVPDGMLVYIKPVMIGGEPADVVDYAARSDKAGRQFPHDTTADQFFDEAQFESYRMLGSYTVDQIRRDYPAFDRIRVAEDGADRRALKTFGIPAPDNPEGSNGHVNRHAPNSASTSPMPRMRDLVSRAGQAASGLGGSAITAAVVTGAVLTVSGTVSVTPPAPLLLQCKTEDGKTVCGTIEFDGKIPEVKVNQTDLDMLKSLTFAEGQKADGKGLRVNPGDLEAVHKPIPIAVNGATVPVNVGDAKVPVDVGTSRVLVDVGKAAVPVSVGDATVPVKPSEVPLDANGREALIRVANQLGSLREELVKLEGLKKLADIDDKLHKLAAAIRAIGPRRNVKSSGREE